GRFLVSSVTQPSVQAEALILEGHCPTSISIITDRYACDREALSEILICPGVGGEREVDAGVAADLTPPALALPSWPDLGGSFIFSCATAVTARSEEHT